MDKETCDVLANWGFADQIPQFYLNNEAPPSEHILWLLNNDSPWGSVFNHWQLSIEERLPEFRHILGNVQDIFNKYPVLKQPSGHELIELDFTYEKGREGTIYLQWPDLSIKLYELMQNKIKDPTSRILLETLAATDIPEAVKRLMREAQELYAPTEEYCAYPLEDNLFEWHFTIQGPPSTDFEGGVYHGRILLPPEYPMKPPNIILLTPNGRFEINKKICLSISGHHPETWQPSWSIRTALLALIAFMPTPGNGTIGSLDYNTEERQKLAKRSLNWHCDNCGRIMNLLSKDVAKKPITEEEQLMLNTIALKAEETTTADSFTSESKNELRQRNVDFQNDHHEQQPEILVNAEVEVMSSTNDLFWSILIASLLSAIILLVLRRLFLV